MPTLSGTAWGMVVAGVAIAAVGVFLLVRLHAFQRETPPALAARIAGTMLTMLGLLLIFFPVAFAADT
ncbi:hypothetical protein [Sphingomonas sp.]|uniref:hypothetical protein n=1 Tax=Sphingomonas sp. TaxID=28214 RepID=UPI003AFFC06D